MGNKNRFDPEKCVVELMVFIAGVKSRRRPFLDRLAKTGEKGKARPIFAYLSAVRRTPLHQ